MMRSEVTILYRGPLSSCNYDCAYCPFAKQHENAAELRRDRAALERFVDWVTDYADGRLSVFFTPWGEALTRSWYQAAIQRLSHLAHIRKVAAQTNLSWSTNWLDQCDLNHLGLWCTYHPSETSRANFLKQETQLCHRNISHSVGMVARPADFAEIAAMRRELSRQTYLWLNAWDTGDGQKYRYSDAEMAFLTNIDPRFSINTVDHASFGRACATGADVFAVDGAGDVRRCHFVPHCLGNIYAGWKFPTASASCPNETCGCHIGYIHMPHLNQSTFFGSGLFERVPEAFVLS